MQIHPHLSIELVKKIECNLKEMKIKLKVGCVVCFFLLSKIKLDTFRTNLVSSWSVSLKT